MWSVYENCRLSTPERRPPLSLNTISLSELLTSIHHFLVTCIRQGDYQLREFWVQVERKYSFMELVELLSELSSKKIIGLKLNPLLLKLTLDFVPGNIY
jgi:hypothetical protein